MKKIAMLSSIFLGLIGSLNSYADAVQGYATGPYLNLGVGGAFFTIDNFFGSGNLTDNSLAARAGLGYIGSITHSEDPFFAGVEANGNYYSLTSGTQANLFGADIAAIIGKQLAPQVGLYGKLGGNL